MYEVLFDDGYMKVVKAVAMSKVKTAVTPEPSPKVTSSHGRKSAPPLPIPKFDLTKFDLLPVPKDGEWCCNWVNDTPIGQEGYLEGPDGHRRPTVLVEDWRLPNGWTKHLYQRSSVSGKWDVVLVGPNKKRFRSKADVKSYLEENGEQYNPDVYDFSIHKRRSKDIGLYVMTDEYKEELKQKIAAQAAAAAAKAAQSVDQPDDPPPLELPETESKVLSILNESDTVITSVADISSEELFPGFPPPSEQSNDLSLPLPMEFKPSVDASLSTYLYKSVLFTPATVPSTPPVAVADPGFVYVGALKVEIVDNLFRCPEPTCNKNFRKENHLQIHVKHYHEEMAKLLGVCPNMTDLACLRTTGQPPDEMTPKNQIPNSHFFEKVYQSDLSTKTIRAKSLASPTSMKSEALVAGPAAATNTADAAHMIVKEDGQSTVDVHSPEKSFVIPQDRRLDDDILQQKLSLLVNSASANDNKNEVAESSFETTFLLQDCIGGYPDPKQQITQNKRTSIKNAAAAAVSDLMDVEGLIETHAVTRPNRGRRGGRKKGGKSKLNRKFWLFFSFFFL